MMECWNDWCIILTECDGVHHVDVTGYTWTEPRGSVYDPRLGRYVVIVKDEVMEHSERGKYVTDQVSMWICNDGDFIDADRTLRRAEYAKELAREHGAEELGAYLTPLMHTAPPYSAPWQVAQELAANDYDRIDWQSVAADLMVE